MPRVVACFYALGAHLFAKHLNATTLHDSLADRGSVGQGQRSDAVNVHYAKMLAVLTSTKPAAQASLAVMTSGIRVALRTLDGEAEGVSEETDDDLEDGL
ncbi:hypothetical protein BCR44DRAFT_1428601 [Catenaria anguillulae PL171]|uniref:Uncharacterized protein n=1 Tax=Catenaria anguillulae PL171 TaxID=765915 RepID=A0A1Y2HVH5_9FUNG|nr:hypothetical protein BCR44DRAFT_1428601 [Catenaria anguillulae PL171]